MNPMRKLEKLQVRMLQLEQLADDADRKLGRAFARWKKIKDELKATRRAIDRLDRDLQQEILFAEHAAAHEAARQT